MRTPRSVWYRGRRSCQFEDEVAEEIPDPLRVRDGILVVLLSQLIALVVRYVFTSTIVGASIQGASGRRKENTHDTPHVLEGQVEALNRQQVRSANSASGRVDGRSSRWSRLLNRLASSVRVNFAGGSTTP